MALRKRHDISLPDVEWRYLNFLSENMGCSISKIISQFIFDSRKKIDPYFKLQNKK